jgi:tetratricopeptide (TPR) repeat protein
MKIVWFFFPLFLFHIPAPGQPAQVSANDLLVEAALIDAAKEKFLRNTDRAVALYKKILKDHPNHDLADYHLAMIYQDSALWEKASAHALSAVKKSPENIWFQQLLASIYLQNDRFQLAIPVLQTCITLDPKNTDSYQKLIFCYQKANDWNAALKVLEDYALVWGLSPQVIRQKHDLYHLSGNIPKAKKEIRSLITLYPSVPDYFYLASSYFAENKDNEGAVKILKELLTRYPDDTRAQFELYQLEGNTTTPSLLSLKSFFSDNRIDPEKKRARLLPELNLLVSSRDPAKMEQLLSLCEAMDEAHPADALPAALRAEIYQIMGRVDTALQHYKKALLRDETVFFVWEKYLRLLWEHGRSALLAQEAEFAWDIFPNNPLIPFYAAYGLVFQGKGPEALPFIEEALIQSSKNEELSLHLNALKAFTFSLQGDKEMATNMFSLLKPKDQPFLRALEILSGLETSSYSFSDETQMALGMHALAFAASRDHQLDLALTLFSKYEPWGTPLFLEHWGDTLLLAGKKADAEIAYRKSAAAGNTGKSLSLKWIKN